MEEKTRRKFTIFSPISTLLLFSILSLYTETINGHNASKILVSPTSQTVVEKSNVSLTCYLEGKPVSNVTWIKDGTPIIPANDNRISVSPPTSVSNTSATITITNVNRTDEGSYSCQAVNDVGNDTSSAALLTVNYPPRILVPPTSPTVVETSNVTLTCYLEGKPVSNVTWIKDGTPIISANDNRISVSPPTSVINTSATITITNVTRTDEGSYSCQSVNDVGNDTSSPALLTVNYPPRILVPPTSQTVVETNSVTLTCYLEGKPVSNVTWIKDGTPIISANDNRVSLSPPTSVSNTSATITITNVTRTDNGSYSCQAVNDVGSDTSSPALLTVNYPSRILVPPTSQTVVERNSVTLTCYLEGKPVSTVTWIKDGTPIIPANDNRISVSPPTSVSNTSATITITNATRTDEGSYSCQSMNDVGNDTSSAALLTVNYGVTIFVHPSTQTKNEGELVTLTCEVEGKPAPEVSWFKNGNPLAVEMSRMNDTQPTTHNRTVVSLTINDLKRTDEGNYSCNVKNSYGEQNSTAALLTVNYPPKILAPPASQTVVESSNVSLTCYLEGQPVSTVTWIKDGTPIIPANDNRISVSPPTSVINTSATITITNVNRTDEGNYSCQAVNNVGNDTSSPALLTVNYGVIILVHPITQTKNEGESVTLTCEVEGKPAPNVTWFKNGNPLAVEMSRMNDTQPTTHHRTVVSLTINDLKRTDEGNYSCNVKNRYGEQNSTAALTVNYPPRILVSPTSQTVVETNNVSLTCYLEGKPVSTVTWIKDGTPIIPANDNRISVSPPTSVINTSATITITNVNRTDEGNYSCQAVNDVGSNTSSTVRLTVNYPPRILVPPTSQTVVETSNVSLTCYLEGKPVSTVTWIKDGTPIISANNNRISVSSPTSVSNTSATITITNVNRTDEGNYSCQAVNNVRTIMSSPALLTVSYGVIIFVHPSAKTRNEGESVTLTCEVEGKPAPNVTWFKNGNPLTVETSRMNDTQPTTQHRTAVSLTINDLKRTDEGNYSCNVKNRNGEQNSTAALLTVNYPSRILVPPTSQTVVETNSVSLTCYLEGKPVSTVTWIKDGTPIIPANDNRISVSPPTTVSNTSATITITNVNRTDEGSYSCQAVNDVGSNTSSTVLLTVYYPAENTKIEITSSSGATVDEGEELVLQCSGGGKPKPTFTWEKDNAEITNGFSGDKNRTLTVKNIQRRDGGIYTCYGNNKIGSKDKSSNQVVITVNDKEITLPTPAYYQNQIGIPVLNFNYTKKGKKICFYFIIAFVGDRTNRSPSEYTLQNITDLKNMMYITGKIGVGRMERFPAGDGKMYPLDGFKDNCNQNRRRKRREIGEFENKKLKPNTKYSFFQRSIAEGGSTETYNWTPVITTPKEPPEVPPIGEIVGAIFGVFLLILLIGFLIWKWKQRRKNGDESDDIGLREQRSRSRLSSIAQRLSRKDHFSAHEQYEPGEVHTAEEFERHVRRLHANSDLLFSQEYATVRSPDTVTSNASLDPNNRFKNRYNNITAFDQTRVLLNKIDGDPSTTYINANYLDGFTKKKEYIASQGPLPDTCDDFWRMVWERGSRLIVMVTNCEEKGRIKCHQYWPSSDSTLYGNLVVTNMSTVELSDYTIRSFGVKMQNSHEERMVTQYHYTAWPDHGVPSSVTSVLNFVRRASAANPPDAGPMVVHCSAGVGRTGTFLVIDAQLKRIQEQSTVDVYNYVMMLRSQRNLMVQVEDQYILIHDVLVEAIACGNTEIQARDLRKEIKNLMQQNVETGQTEMELQFQRLSRNKAPPSKFQAANLQVNKHKNRYANVLPYDDTRVKLSIQPGVDGSDYINANYIGGYMQKRAFIATQAPIPDTIPDFWRMIWEQECHAIVMLSQEMESGKVKVHRYWPGKAPTAIANLVVEMTQEKSYDDYIMREFKVTNTGESASRVVRQYHFTAWPDVGSPDSSAGLTDLIGQVQRWQQRCGNTLVTVHCSAGVGRTGVFCAVSSLIERLKAEAAVDVFQTVKQLREQRPAMVQTKEQYEFCYQTLGEYLDSFDPYNNFD